MVEKQQKETRSRIVGVKDMGTHSIHVYGISTYIYHKTQPFM